MQKKLYVNYKILVDILAQTKDLIRLGQVNIEATKLIWSNALDENQITNKSEFEELIENFIYEIEDENLVSA